VIEGIEAGESINRRVTEHDDIEKSDGFFITAAGTDLESRFALREPE